MVAQSVSLLDWLWDLIPEEKNGEGGIRTLGTRLKVQRFSKAERRTADLRGSRSR